MVSRVTQRFHTNASSVDMISSTPCRFFNCLTPSRNPKKASGWTSTSSSHGILRSLHQYFPHNKNFNNSRESKYDRRTCSKTSLFQTLLLKFRADIERKWKKWEKVQAKLLIKWKFSSFPSHFCLRVWIIVTRATTSRPVRIVNPLSGTYRKPLMKLFFCGCQTQEHLQ